jgi:hypothetical protein
MSADGLVPHYDIFISYAREDLARVGPIVAALEAEGWKVFWDRTIPPGETWRTFIGVPLDTAPVVVTAWSAHSIISRYVVSESDRAESRHALVPVRLDDVKPPLGLDHIQPADLMSWLATGGGALPPLLKTSILNKISDSRGASPIIADHDHSSREGRSEAPGDRSRQRTALEGLDVERETEVASPRPEPADETGSPSDLNVASVITFKLSRVVRKLRDWGIVVLLLPVFAAVTIYLDNHRREMQGHFQEVERSLSQKLEAEVTLKEEAMRLAEDRLRALKKIEEEKEARTGRMKALRTRLTESVGVYRKLTTRYDASGAWDVTLYLTLPPDLASDIKKVTYALAKCVVPPAINGPPFESKFACDSPCSVGGEVSASIAVELNDDGLIVERWGSACAAWHNNAALTRPPPK